IVFSAQLFLVAESHFPVLLQRAGDKPILGFDGLKLSRRAIGLMRRPFQLLPPQLVEACPFLFEITGGSQAEFQRRRLQNFEDPFGDEMIQIATDDSLAEWFTPILCSSSALIAQPIRAAAVLHHQ